MAPREAEFRRTIESDPDIARVLGALSAFDAPDCWLVSGALFQTVWNRLEGRPQGYGIRDIDLFYFDEDPSYEAEDRWIAKAARHFEDAPKPVELRNQARVHLWYREKFGVPGYPKLTSSCDGVRQFLVQASVVAVKPDRDGGFELFAPLGLDDIFDRIVRPNPLWTQGPRAAYAAKAARYKRDWPSLRVMGEEAA